MPEVCPAPSTPSRKKRTILSIPVTPEERTDLDRRRGKAPLATYARNCLFPANDNAKAASRRARRQAGTDDAVHAAILAKLGSANIRRNLDDMARLARLGALPVTPETEAALQQACCDVAEIKSLLMKALRVREE